MKISQKYGTGRNSVVHALQRELQMRKETTRNRKPSINKVKLHSSVNKRFSINTAVCRYKALIIHKLYNELNL